jgi:hypothetical protein
VIGGTGIGLRLGYTHRQTPDLDILTFDLDSGMGPSGMTCEGRHVDVLAIPPRALDWMYLCDPTSLLECNLAALAFLMRAAERDASGAVAGSACGLFLSKAVVMQMRCWDIERFARDAYDMCALLVRSSEIQRDITDAPPGLLACVMHGVQRYFVERANATASRIRNFVSPSADLATIRTTVDCVATLVRHSVSPLRSATISSLVVAATRVGDERGRLDRGLSPQWPSPRYRAMSSYSQLREMSRAEHSSVTLGLPTAPR